MTWTLVDTHGSPVGGPFSTAHDAVAAQRSCPYLRLDKIDAGRFEVDAGFSATDHGHYHLVETTPAAAA